MKSMTTYKEEVMKYFKENEIACIGPFVTWHTDESDKADDNGRESTKFEHDIYENACIQAIVTTKSDESYISHVTINDEEDNIYLVIDTPTETLEVPYIFIDLQNNSDEEESEIKELKVYINKLLEENELNKVEDVFKSLQNHRI